MIGIFKIDERLCNKFKPRLMSYTVIPKERISFYILALIMCEINNLTVIWSKFYFIEMLLANIKFISQFLVIKFEARLAKVSVYDKVLKNNK